LLVVSFGSERKAQPEGGAPNLFLVALFEEEVNQLCRRDFHFDQEFVHFAGEVFEQPYSRDRHGESDHRGDERFRDTAGDGRDAMGFSILCGKKFHFMSCVDTNTNMIDFLI
jgi:hypothetical protein